MTPLVAAVQLLAVLTGTADGRALAADPQDPEVLWVGTAGGLLRVDGARATRFTPRDGLPDGTVRALRWDDGALWVGTDRGAIRCRPDGDSLGVEGRPVGPRLRVEAIAKHEGAIYLGATTGLFVVRGEEAVPIEGFGRVTALASAPDGLYAASPGRGAFRWDGRAARRLRGDRLAWALAVEGRVVWVATSRGLERHRDGRRIGGAVERASRALPVPDLRAVAVHDGELVVGSLGGGVWRREGSRFTRVDALPSDARVQALAHGPSGWVAATPEDLAGAKREPGELPDNDLTALARTDEGLWIGTFDRGLVLRRDDGTVRTFDEASGLLDDRINRLAVDAEGDLWIATDRGVAERTGGRFVLRGLLDRHVFALGFVDGAIHAGAGADAYRYEGGAFRTLAQPGSRPQDFAHDGEGVLVASAEGLATRRGRAWSLTTSDDGLVDDWVTAVTADRGTVYLGTYASGVSRLRDGGLEVLRDDLWVNAGALAVVDGTLAVGTLDDGLWLERGGQWTRLGAPEGLPDEDVTAVLADADGTVWVATRGGLVHLRLD